MSADWTLHSCYCRWGAWINPLSVSAFNQPNKTFLSGNVKTIAVIVCNYQKRFPSFESMSGNTIVFCFLFWITIYPGDRGRFGQAERHISYCCRDSRVQIFKVIFNMQGQRGKLTCCFCSPAAVGATSAVPDHQLSALHHGFKCLSVNAYTHNTKQSEMQWEITPAENVALFLRTIGLLSTTLSKGFRILTEVRKLSQGNWKQLQLLVWHSYQVPPFHPQGATTAYAPKTRLLAPQFGHINSHEHSHGHGPGNGHHHVPPVPGKGRGRRRT